MTIKAPKKRTPKHKRIVYILPAHWASYLMNNDASSVDQEDIEAIDRFVQEQEQSILNLLKISENEFYTSYLDVSGFPACTCLEYKFKLPD